MKCIKCEEKESIKESSFCQKCMTIRDDKWNTCRHCGIKDKEETSNWVMNSCCRKCNDKIDKKIDFNSAKEDGYITRDESIMCPYCGYVDDDISECHDSKSFECPECEKESELSVEYTAHFTTTKK